MRLCGAFYHPFGINISHSRLHIKLAGAATLGDRPDPTPLSHLATIRAAASGEGTSLDRLAALIRAHIDFFCKNVATTTVYLQELRRFDPAGRTRLFGRHSYRDVFQQVIEEGQRDGLILRQFERKPTYRAMLSFLTSVSDRRQPLRAPERMSEGEGGGSGLRPPPSRGLAPTLGFALGEDGRVAACASGRDAPARDTCYNQTNDRSTSPNKRGKLSWRTHAGPGYRAVA